MELKNTCDLGLSLGKAVQDDEQMSACVAALRAGNRPLAEDDTPPGALSKTNEQKAKPAPSISSPYFQDSDEVNVPDYEPGDAAH